MNSSARRATSEQESSRVDLSRHPALHEAMLGELTPKFLATRSPEGIPNVVPMTSLTPAQDESDLVHFGNFLLRKSLTNLERDPRVSMLVITESLEGWGLTGSFEGFQREGPYAEAQRSARLLRYNAYTGIRNAGLIRVRAIENTFRISKTQLISDFALAGSAGLGKRAIGGIELPLAVRKEFARVAALKVIGWLDTDGFPRLAPALSLQPAGTDSMTCWPDDYLREGPEDGANVSANVLTPEAVSYQIRGTWQRGRRGCTLIPHEAYAGGPPLPGARIA